MTNIVSTINIFMEMRVLIVRINMNEFFTDNIVQKEKKSSDI